MPGLTTPPASCAAAILAFTLLWAGPTAHADIVTLKTGTTLEGKVEIRDVPVAGDAADTGGEATKQVVVRTRYGSVEYPYDQIADIKYGETFDEKVEKRLAELATGEMEVSEKLSSYTELGNSCREQGWESMAHDLYLHALSLDNSFFPAREALGYQLVDGKWMTEDEIMVAKGLIKYKGKWVHKDEVRASESAKYWQDMQKDVDRLKGKMASKVVSRRDAAYEEMVALRDKIPGIVQAADVLRDYYDRYYRMLAARGEVVTEIRATVASLKRPIETFETTLATGSVFSASTLVQIQIPELNVTSVKTTVAVPLVKWPEDE